jgi:hypothetical protein
MTRQANSAIAGSLEHGAKAMGSGMLGFDVLFAFASIIEEAHEFIDGFKKEFPIPLPKYTGENTS